MWLNVVEFCCACLCVLCCVFVVCVSVCVVYVCMRLYVFCIVGKTRIRTLSEENSFVTFDLVQSPVRGELARGGERWHKESSSFIFHIARTTVSALTV